MSIALLRRRGQLSVGADPLEGESLPGFLMRVASRAGFIRADRLARIVGGGPPGSAVTTFDLDGLAELIGTPKARLEAIAYRPVARVGHHRFCGGVVHREFLLLDRRRFCPRCHTESLHHRARWDFALATACVEHRIRLIEQCPSCGRRFGWFNSNLSKCRCGTNTLGIASQAVGSLEAAANRIAIDIVRGVHHLPAGLANVERADLPCLAFHVAMNGGGPIL